MELLERRSDVRNKILMRDIISHFIEVIGAPLCGLLLSLAYPLEFGYVIAIIAISLNCIIIHRSRSGINRFIQALLFVSSQNIGNYWFLVSKIQSEYGMILIILSIVFVKILPFIAIIFFKKNPVELFLLLFLLSDYLFSAFPVGNSIFQLGILLSDIPTAISWYSVTGINWGSLYLILISYTLYRTLYFHRDYSLLIISITLPFLISYIFTSISSNQQKISVGLISLSKNEDKDKIHHILEKETNNNDKIILIPEGTFYLNENEVQFAPNITELIRYSKRYRKQIAVGLFVQSKEYVNNYIAILSPEDDIKRKHKSILIPFAEYLPMESILEKSAYIKDKVISPVKRQIDNQHIFVIDSHKVSFLICYEALFSNYLSDLSKEGAEVFFIESSNTFINSEYLEKVIIKLLQAEAITLQRSFARSVENGESCIIDNTGKILYRDMKSTKYVSKEVPTNKYITPYVKFRKKIDFTYILTILLLLVYFIAEPDHPRG